MKRLLRGLLVFSVLMVALFGGYLYISYEKSQTPDTKKLEESTAQYQKPLELKKGRMEDISVNLIYYVSQEDSVIKEAVLEILNCKQKTLSYVVIPANTQISVGSKLYQKMTAINAKMPQYFLASHMKKSIGNKKWAGYGQLIMDQMLNVDTSCYTVIYGTEGTFEEHVNQVKRNLSDSSSIKTYLKEIYAQKLIKSNLKKTKKLHLAKYYAEVSSDKLKFYDLPGTDHQDTFEWDSYKTGILITELSQGIQ